MLATPGFTGGGFDLGVGARHFTEYDPNSIGESTAAKILSVGILAIPKGALLGNEHGIEFNSRVHFGSEKRVFLESSLRLASRVMTAKSRLNLPSVLGALLPTVGIATLVTPDPAHLGPNKDDTYFLARWAFAPRYIATRGSAVVFIELEPSIELLAPFEGGAPRGAFAVGTNLGVFLN